MEPTAQTNNQTLDSTFSSQVNPEGLLPSDVASANNQVQALHQRNRYFQLLWAVLIAIALLLVGLAVWLFLRNNTKVISTTGVAEQYSPTRVNLTNTGNPTAVNLGQVNINGDLQVLGDIAVGGSINGNGSGITNINPNNISGVIPVGQLDPNVALLNRNFQTFVGTNQFFRNSSNSVAAFEIQNASSAPIFSVDTSQGAVAINSTVTSQNGLQFETNGNGRFAGTLQVGAQSNPSVSILNTGTLFSNDIQRVLTVQDITQPSTNVPGRIYVGTSAELLADPQIDPVAITYYPLPPGFPTNVPLTVSGNKNIFAGGYSAVQTASTNSKDYFIVGGNLSGATHAGSGNVLVDIGQFSTVSNVGAGSITAALANVVAPTMTQGGITNYTGYTALDPQSSALTGYGLQPLITGGSLFTQTGIDIQWQHSATGAIGTFANLNLYSEGQSSNNLMEGSLIIGQCNTYSAVNLYELLNIANPTNRTNCLSSTANQVRLTVAGTASQTSDLSRWTNSSGTVLDSISSSGKLNVQGSGSEFALNVGNTSLNGGLMIKGTFGSGDTLTTTGIGTRAFVYPKKAAFRAGIITGSGPYAGAEWNDANIGDRTVVFGKDSAAVGSDNFVAGNNLNVTGSANAVFGDATGFGASIAGIGNFSVGPNTISATTGVGNAVFNVFSGVSSVINTIGTGGNVVFGNGNSISTGSSNRLFGNSITATGSNAYIINLSSTAVSSSASNVFSVMNGKVGIGSTNPTARLDVSGSSGTEITAIFDNGTSTGDIMRARDGGTQVFALANEGAATFQNKTNSTAAFQIQNAAGTSNLLIADTTNTRIGIGASGPTNTLTVTNTGTTSVAKFNGSSSTQCTVVTGTGWSCSSDERLKTNILSIDDGLDKIMQLRGVTFNWVSDPNGEQQDGFIAQEVQKVLPELVSTDTNGYQSLNKDGILAYLVKAVQQQQSQIDQLKNIASSSATSIDVIKILADAQAVTLSGDLTVNGQVVVAGNLQLKGDNTGVIRVPAGQTRVRMSFNRPFQVAPNVTLTAKALTKVSYAVDNESTTGFDVILESPQDQDTVLNYHAL
ncbi:tail fiber domain-containing protein [Candidatus Saccharibacteria bacterium]|nr:tail fiber domain-containing protein [Candidatus Saccharibacteria bacterium]